MDHELADVFPGFPVSYVQSAEGSRFKINNFCICWALPTSCTTTESEKHSWRERRKWGDVVGRTTWHWWRVVDSEVQIDNTCPPWPEVRFWQKSWPQYLNLYNNFGLSTGCYLQCMLMVVSPPVRTPQRPSKFNHANFCPTAFLPLFEVSCDQSPAGVKQPPKP